MAFFAAHAAHSAVVALRAVVASVVDGVASVARAAARALPGYHSAAVVVVDVDHDDASSPPCAERTSPILALLGLPSSDDDEDWCNRPPSHLAQRVLRDSGKRREENTQKVRRRKCKGEIDVLRLLFFFADDDDDDDDDDASYFFRVWYQRVESVLRLEV